MWFLGKWLCLFRLDMRQANRKFAASSWRIRAKRRLFLMGINGRTKSQKSEFPRPYNPYSNRRADTPRHARRPPIMQAAHRAFSPPAASAATPSRP
jgi:hypothetical protein